MKKTIMILFLFLNGIINAQNIDSTQQLKNDFITDSCGTLGMRYKYVNSIEKITTTKTKNEVIELLGKPNYENKNSIHYIIKAKKCNGIRKTIFTLDFNKEGKCDRYGFKEI